MLFYEHTYSGVLFLIIKIHTAQQASLIRKCMIKKITCLSKNCYSIKMLQVKKKL